MPTQQAPLEQILSSIRLNTVNVSFKSKTVLDFGCGRDAWNCRAMVRKGALLVHGVDKCFKQEYRISQNINLFSWDDFKPSIKYDLITAFAVFEHIEPIYLPKLLTLLRDLIDQNGMLVGTVPTPRAKPVLEFLSYRLKLIDSSQILDHKVYYDNYWFEYVIRDSPWRLYSYKKFQIGMNSAFALKPI